LFLSVAPVAPIALPQSIHMLATYDDGRTPRATDAVADAGAIIEGH
jgi:hypothetical protein